MESNCEYCLQEILKKIRINNGNRVFIGHINFNYSRKKFDMLSSMVKDNIDILMVSETKLDFSFPQTQFRIERYAPLFRYYKTSYSGGIPLFIRQDISANIVSITALKDFERFLWN